MDWIAIQIRMIWMVLIIQCLKFSWKNRPIQMNESLMAGAYTYHRSIFPLPKPESPWKNETEEVGRVVGPLAG